MRFMDFKLKSCVEYTGTWTLIVCQWHQSSHLITIHRIMGAPCYIGNLIDTSVKGMSTLQKRCNPLFHFYFIQCEEGKDWIGLAPSADFKGSSGKYYGTHGINHYGWILALDGIVKNYMGFYQNHVYIYIIYLLATLVSKTWLSS